VEPSGGWFAQKHVQDMCGIAGIIGSIDETNQSALRRMTTAIAHRGPDSDGFWTSPADSRGRGCMLGHRRLSIIDLSRAGDQPMRDASGPRDHTIVFNGEIYNFQDLRRELDVTEAPLQSAGDTAVMLRLLADQGHEALSRLRGMFAFAMWDARRKRLLLARDPLGIKPLYIARNPDPDAGWSLMFASEIRAILASGLMRPKLNRQAVASIVWNGFVVGPDTAVEGIESLRPGEARVVDASGTTKHSSLYWRMPGPEEKGAAQEEDLRAALSDSVKRHLISDVPLGIFLSGGVDSSAVANLAKRASTGPVHTFTLAFEEEAYNEGTYARRIAEGIGTEHREILLSQQEFASELDRAIDTIDQPTFDGLNSYYISKAVREAGLTVALVGTGGDELFGGYSSFSVLPRLLRLDRQSRMIPGRAKRAAAEIARRLLSGRASGSVPPQTRWAKFPAMVEAGDNLLGLYQLAYALFLPEFQGRLLLDRDAADSLTSGVTADMAQRLCVETRNHSALSAVSAFEQRLFLGERLLRDTDAASMAVSLETRLPLVDSVIVETVARLSDEARYAPVGRKAILRRVGLAGLDPALFDRPKSGFVLPFDKWIRSSLGTVMDSTMRDASLARGAGLDGEVVSDLWSAFQEGAPGLYWSRIWALYILIRWCHRHSVLA
jgi:asparagine synthase (glutamine-hydrolysing)